MSLVLAVVLAVGASANGAAQDPARTADGQRRVVQGLILRALRTAGPEALARVTGLCDRFGPRPLGSEAAAAVAREVARELDAAEGLVVQSREWSCGSLWRRGGSSLVVLDGRPLAVTARPWSAATPGAGPVEVSFALDAGRLVARGEAGGEPGAGTVAYEVFEGPENGHLPSPWPGRVPEDGGSGVAFTLAGPDALFVRRAVAAADPPKVRGALVLEAGIGPAEAPCLDVVATLPAGAPSRRLPGSVVLLTRLDADDVGPAAQDAAAFVVVERVAVELARQVAQGGVGPRRPVHFVFASGLETEEVPPGVAARPGPPPGVLDRVPELSRAGAVVLVCEARPGGGLVRGVALEGQGAWVAPMERAFEPLSGTPYRVDDLGIRSEPGAHRLLRRGRAGGTEAPVEAFAVLQDRIAVGLRHTRVDTPERLADADLAQAVAALAVAVWHLANDPELPSRTR